MMIELTAEYSAGYADGMDYQVGGHINMYGLPDYPRSQILAELENNKAATPSALMGFAYDASSLETELAAYNAIIAEVQYLIATGTVDPKTAVPDLLARLDADALIAAFQAQVDAWKAANSKSLV